jgi:hypothetical protein
MVQVAAILHAVISLAVIGFQIALAAGAPWGAYAMGGAVPGRLPPALRIAALIQAAVIAGMAVVVLARAELILPGMLQISQWLIWIVVALEGLSLILNLITPSAEERAIWVPTLSLLLVTSVIVALSSSSM